MGVRARAGACVHPHAEAPSAQNPQLTVLRARVAFVYICYYSLGKYVSNYNVHVSPEDLIKVWILTLRWG